MAKYTTLTGLFTAIADAIREKTGESSVITADDFPEKIQSIAINAGQEAIESQLDEILTIQNDLIGCTNQ